MCGFVCERVHVGQLEGERDRFEEASLAISGDQAITHHLEVPPFDLFFFLEDGTRRM